jgi:hypothetical protein
MTTRGKIELALGLVLVVAGALAGRTWLTEHDARIRGEEQLKASSAQIDQLKAQDAARDKQAAAQVATIEQSAAAQKTPQQIVKWIPMQVSLPAPIRTEIPPATPANPAPDVQVQVPQADLSIIRDDVAKCETCTVQLQTAQADLASSKKQQELLQGQVSDLQTELKGGMFWKRMKRALKWFGIGAAAGAVALCGSGHCK